MTTEQGAMQSQDNVTDPTDPNFGMSAMNLGSNQTNKKEETNKEETKYTPQKKDKAYYDKKIKKHNITERTVLDNMINVLNLSSVDDNVLTGINSEIPTQDQTLNQ